MSNEFVLSVVVPTRNRAEFASGVIRQVLSINAPDLQLVIQDNSDNDSLSRTCERYAGDGRLKYGYTPEALSFVANFSAGVAMADGEYVCIIGDDDGINPEILEVARWAHGAGVRAVKPGLQAIYFWPGAGLRNADDSGQLVVHRVDHGVRVGSTGPELVKLLENGCQDYLSLDLAKLYHGLVRRDALEQVRGTAGEYFGGLSPDIYSAVALSAVINEVVCINYPLTLSGICEKSGSADSATGRHTGALADAPHFRGHTAYDWADEVPEFYSVETIWADSSLAAVRDMCRNDLLREYRPESLAAYCLFRHPEFGQLVLQHYRDSCARRNVSSSAALISLVTACFRGPLRDLAMRVSRRLAARGVDTTKYSGIRDIAAAAAALAGYLEANGLDARRCIAELEQQARTGEEPT